MVLDDLKVKGREFADATGILIWSVVEILHEDLGMRKLTANWMQRLLTIYQKRKPVGGLESCIDLFNSNSRDFSRRLVTIDETWIHNYTPKLKLQAK